MHYLYKKKQYVFKITVVLTEARCRLCLYTQGYIRRVPGRPFNNLEAAVASGNGM